MMDDHTWYFHPRIADNSGHIAEPDKFKPVRAKQSGALYGRKDEHQRRAQYFATRDFRNFTPISQVSNGGATGRYDGSNTRLVSYPLPDGSICDGVLHTPVHFDSTQKYPVIFTYYERHSEVKACLQVP